MSQIVSPNLRYAATDAELPKPRSAMLGAADVAARLNIGESLVRNWIRDGLLPAWRYGERRTYIDPDDLELIADQLPRLPASIGYYVAQMEKRAADAEDAANERAAAADKEIARIEELLEHKRRDARWTLLEELTLEELLDYLREFRSDDRELWNARHETLTGLQRAIDRNAQPASLGARPKRVPTHAKSRRLATAIGQVDIWYWRSERGVWFAVYGGPRAKQGTGRGGGYSTAYAAIKFAGQQARYVYGVPVRRSSARLRFAVLERDGFACHYCGRKPPEVELHVDHVIPVAEGGANDASNLVASCPDCNHGKSARLLEGTDPA